MISHNLLVSSPGIDGGLFLVYGNTAARLVSRAITGICAFNGRLIFAHQDNGGNSVKLFSNGAVEDRSLSDSPMDLHDLHYHDGVIYAADTETNSVIGYDTDWHIVNRWSLAGEPDSAHLNSVIYYRNLLLVSVFGRFQRNREYKEGTLGRGEIIDIQSGDTYIDGLSQPHSLKVIDDLLYVCSSEDCELRIYDGKTLLHRIPVPGYARGLAISEEKIYVGLSLSRNMVFNEVGAESAKIIVIDRSTLQIKDYVSIPAQEIYDLSCSALSIWMLPFLLQEQTQEIEKQNEMLRQYKRGYESYKHESDERYRKIKELNVMLELIKKSKSWRITAPLRYINANIFKKFGD